MSKSFWTALKQAQEHGKPGASAIELALELWSKKAFEDGWSRADLSAPKANYEYKTFVTEGPAIMMQREIKEVK